MMNCTFDDAHTAGKDAAAPEPQAPVRAREGSGGARDLTFIPSRSGNDASAGGVPDILKPLTDPVFQNMGYNARFLIDYCRLPA